MSTLLLASTVVSRDEDEIVVVSPWFSDPAIDREIHGSPSVNSATGPSSGPLEVSCPVQCRGVSGKNKLIGRGHLTTRYFTLGRISN